MSLKCVVQCCYIEPPDGLLELGRSRTLLAYLRPILQVCQSIRSTFGCLHCKGSLLRRHPPHIGLRRFARVLPLNVSSTHMARCFRLGCR